MVQSGGLLGRLLGSLLRKLLETTRNKKKKHNKVVLLARGNLSSIESKISETLIKMKLVKKIQRTKRRHQNDE